MGEKSRYIREKASHKKNDRINDYDRLSQSHSKLQTSFSKTNTFKY